MKNSWEDQGTIHGYDFEKQRFGAREGRVFQTKDQTAQRRGGVQGGLGSGAGVFRHEGHMKKWVENRL